MILIKMKALHHAQRYAELMQHGRQTWKAPASKESVGRPKVVRTLWDQLWLATIGEPV